MVRDGHLDARRRACAGLSDWRKAGMRQAGPRATGDHAFLPGTDVSAPQRGTQEQSGLGMVGHHKTVWNKGVICINMLQLHFGAWQFQNLPPKNCRGSPWTEARLVSSELCGFEVQRISYAGCDGPQCSAFAVQQHVLRSLVPHGADPKQLQASGLKEHCSVILSETKWNWNYVYILIICII